MRKSDCTAEQWEKYLRYMRERRKNPEIREKDLLRNREYFARPEIKQRRRVHDARPDMAAKRRDYHLTESAKSRAKERYAEVRQDPEKWAARLAEQRKRRTGFDPELFRAIIALQGNKCAICEVSFDDRIPVADHCHRSSKPRGILCHQCNWIEGALALYKITPSEFARRLEHYVANPPSLSSLENQAK